MRVRIGPLLTSAFLLVACGDDSAAQGGGGAGGGASGGAGSGAGGSGPGGVRECTTDEDCIIRNDCCACASMPAGASPVGECEMRCEQSSCSALGIEPEAACSAGQCVFATSCNAATVACDAAPPSCSPGTIASVAGACWGPCIAASECRDVTSCADCGSLACLEEVAFTVTHQCIATAGACPSAPDCECLSELCYQGDLCSAGEDADVSCECISC